MESGSLFSEQENHRLQARVNELERQLAAAHAVISDTAAPSGNNTLRRFELLFANSRDIILFIRQSDGVILDANAAALQTYGYDRDEIRALTINALRNPTTQALTAEQMARASSGGLTFETQHRRKNGSVFPVEVSSQGAILGDERILVSVVRDITDRKKAEVERSRLLEELQREKTEAQQRAEELNAIIESMHDPVLVYDRDGLIYRANAAAVRAHGFDPSRRYRDETNRALTMRTADGSLAHSDQLPSARALKGDTVVGEPLEVTNANGQTSTVLVSSTPLVISGAQVGAVSVWHDISAQRQAEQAMQAALASAEEGRRLLEAILENVPVGLSITGGPPDFPVVRVSRHGLEMNRRPVADLVGMPTDQHQYAWNFLLPDGVTRPEPEQMPLYRASRLGETIRNQELIMVTDGGQHLSILVNATPVRDQEGRIVGAVNAWLDITGLKSNEQALAASRQRIDDILNSLGEGLFALDRQWNFIYANESASRIAGIPARDLIGKNLWEIWPVLRGTPLERAYLDVMETRQPRSLRVSGLLTQRWYDVNVYPSSEGITVYFVDRSEQVESERALKESEQRYNALFNAKTNAIAHCRIITDEAGKPVDFEILGINDAYETLYGLHRQMVIGRRALERPDLAKYTSAVIPIYGKIALEGGETSFETYFEPLKKWLSLYVYSSKPGEFTLLLTDITARKKAEQELREARDRATWLARLPGENPHPVARVSAAGEVLYHNSAAARRPGWKFSIGQTLSEPMLGLVRQAMGGVKEIQAELTLGVCIYDVVVMPFPMEGYANLYGRDITNNKRVEEALRDSEERLRIAVKNANAVYAQTDHELRYRWIYNPHPDFSPDAVIGKTDVELDDSEETRHLYHLKKQVLESGLGLRKEVSFHLSDGVHTYDMIFEPVRDPNGQVTGVSSASVDITDLKRAQQDLSDYAERLRLSNQELEQFAFVASHDLQEPLRKIIRFGEAAKDRLQPDLSPDEVIEAAGFLNRMQNAAERMQRMIDGLLELSRVSTQGRKFEPVDLNRIAREVLSDLEARVQQAQGRIEIGDLPTIEADPLQMRQLLQNLIANGLKFHQPEQPPILRVHGEIQRTRPARERCATIEIVDEGIGFDEADAPFIFQPFRRLHGREEFEGTGMGLAICQRIVERHRGKISVRSRPGQGATFQIELPIKQTG